MFAISLLFAFSAIFAIGSIVQGTHRYGRKALALHSELATCPEFREVRFRIVEFKPCNVVPLPLRPLAVRPLEGLRAAA
jgi:hypothetical protein